MDPVTYPFFIQTLNFRVKECMITNANEDRSAYLIHSMHPAGTCYNQRLAVERVSTSSNLEFTFRNFRFTTDDGDHDPQNQKLRCKLYLNPSTVSQTPTDCSCFSPSECSAAETSTLAIESKSCTIFNIFTRHVCFLERFKLKRLKLERSLIK